MEGVTVWGMNSLYRGTESVGTQFTELLTIGTHFIKEVTSVELTLQRELLYVKLTLQREFLSVERNSIYRGTTTSCGEGIYFTERITVCGRNTLYGRTPASCGQELALQSV
jgi:hypothetical protein